MVKVTFYRSIPPTGQIDYTLEPLQAHKITNIKG